MESTIKENMKPNNYPPANKHPQVKASPIGNVNSKANSMVNGTIG
jgi:hypothetical protein